MNYRPILVTGKSRSGKSLINKLLGLHPNIAAHSTELRIWPRFYRRYGDLSQPANFERCLAAMLSHRAIRSFINDADYVRRKFREGEPTYGRLFALFFEYYAERQGKPRWADQSQAIERYADAIFASYPTSQIIHLIRDPRDRYSRKEVIYRGRGRQKELREFYRHVGGWLRSVYLAERNQKQYPERYKIVRYETLVSQPKETLHDICTFLGEADIPAAFLTDGMRGFRDDSGESKHDNISTAYIGRFRETMSEREIAFMQARSKQAMAAYDYALVPVQLSLKDYLMLYFIDWPYNMAVRWRNAVKPILFGGDTATTR